MKILVINNLFPPNAVGGYERLCHAVAVGLAARGHEISVITSDYGKAVRERDETPGLSVERSLKLLTDTDNIYAPFLGSQADRDAINRQNLEKLRAKIAAERPDRAFIGNLFFFDPSILEAVVELGKCAVLLLTDNWLLNFLNPNYVGAFFRENVLNK